MAISGEYVPSPAEWVRKQVEAFESSNGSEANTLADSGDPIIVITNVGAKSGKIRKTPLMRVERDGKYLAVASKGGAPEDPQWAANFRAHPDVELQDGPVKKAYRVRELAGAERAEWWDHAVATWGTYAEYQKKTDRQIPLFLLEPVD
ncbi:nitroreductase family deazaflavin-dependent oxidoreductase [Nocardioides sp.]|uniref:nitroreductase family deazaflavin-dependent oxidoreductase n=1 Tax=Nocardioides sp. TaxID=35761 RepID=UPI00260BC81C|nr:nitroreductase family deazaflavin-dependent oxidoreductase [Nocardioides sp.]